MKPSIGRIVIVETAADYNGTNRHPAIINRVWGDGEPQPGADGVNPPTSVCVNVTVLPDCGMPFSMTSIALHHSEADAMQIGFYGQRAWWPERV